MRQRISLFFAAGVLVLGIAAALAQSAPAKIADTSKGKALVDSAGMTLYTLDRDTTGKSSCNGVCATNWPPFLADAAASGDWSIVTRDDGRRQWAYKGKSLYAYYKDGNPGDANGDGVNNVWHIATP